MSLGKQCSVDLPVDAKSGRLSETIDKPQCHSSKVSHLELRKRRPIQLTLMNQHNKKSLSTGQRTTGLGVRTSCSDEHILWDQSQDTNSSGTHFISSNKVLDKDSSANPSILDRNNALLPTSPDPSIGPTVLEEHSNCRPTPIELTREDFLSLLSLSPSHVTERHRACTRPRLSKYLHIKARELWNNMYKDKELSDQELPLMPSHVKLTRNKIIDRLAVQENPQSINLKLHRIGSRKVKRRRKLNVKNQKPRGVVVGDSKQGQPDSHTTCEINSSHAVIALSDPVTERHCRDALVRIKRDHLIDQMALQTANILFASPCDASSAWYQEGPSALKSLVVKVYRDSSIDKLALQSTEIGSGCSTLPDSARLNPTVSRISHFPTTETSNTGLNSILNHVSPVESESVDVIKLKRIPCGNWSVIPRAPDCAERSSDSVCSCSETNISTLNSNSSLSSASFTSISNSPAQRFPEATYGDQVSPAQLNQFTSVCELGPVIGSPLASRTTRSRTTRLSFKKPDTFPTSHQNENKNPRKRAAQAENLLPPRASPPSRVVEPLVLRRSHSFHLRFPNDFSGKHVSRSLRSKHCAINYSVVNSTITQYMPIKKPLGQVSPNYQSHWDNPNKVTAE